MHCAGYTGEIHISSNTEDWFEEPCQSPYPTVSDSAGIERTPRPPAGRESDGKGIVEWSKYTNSDGSSIVRYSITGPVQASLELVLPSAEDWTENGRELCRLLEDVWCKLVLLRPPISVLSRARAGHHARDVQRGADDNVQPDYDDAWIAPVGHYQGFPDDWADASRYFTVNSAHKGTGR